jgi:hypothetical protein
MKKLIVAVAALGSVLAGCVAVEPIGYTTYGYGTTYYEPTARVYRDRDGDGVPNRWDARPGNPYRY